MRGFTEALSGAPWGGLYIVCPQTAPWYLAQRDLVAVITTLPGLETCPSLISFLSTPTLALDSD